MHKLRAMGQTLLAAVTSGLALAGVLVVAGTGAGRFSRGVPHIGAGALGAAVAVVAGRLPNMAAAPKLLVLVAVGLLAGIVGRIVDERVRNVDAPVWPPALLPELAVLGLALGVAGMFRPSTAIELPLGPLGGVAPTWGALAACITGFAFAAVAVSSAVRRRTSVAWAVVVAGTAAAVSLAAGTVIVGGEVVVPAFGIPDVAGLALRAAAVGVFARRGWWPGVAAAVALGVGESLLRSQLSTGEAALLPALLILGWGVWRDSRGAPTPAVA